MTVSQSDGTQRPVGEDRGFIATLIADGRPPLSLTGMVLVLCGLFAFFLASTGHFLPHDVQFLGMQPADLCSINECRVVHFMMHDRVAFGGTLIGVGALYLWLAAFPLRRRESWAWWLFVVSGAIGFGSFLTYLGYGYLDTWHGVATLGLLPVFLVGIARSHVDLTRPATLRSLLQPGVLPASRIGRIGRALLLLTSACLVLGGLIIMGVGMTTVFVPQDLAYIGLTGERLHSINPRLVPLIAHDRAGFGGGVCCVGLTMFFCVWCARPCRSLWQALFIAGCSGFGAAIGVHPAIGYTDFLHLAPAYVGAAMFALGMALSFPDMMRTAAAYGASP